MRPEPKRIRELFVAALGKDDPALRETFLEEACVGDEELLREVQLLLKAHWDASHFLESPAVPPLMGLDSQALVEGPGTVIGPYRLLERIGEGGMGIVYMAEQTQPVRRKVALKLIKPGMDTRQVIARFEAERQALALMDHPNIARILDAGATESGRPYFVMELVRGVPITEYCDRNCLSIPDRLDVFMLVCQAVHHAHQKGIIHRDLKPSNVLITLHDGTPVPKVIDFGIAKATGQQSLTDKTLFTGFAELIGTPMYLSPEQAALSGIDIDTRSDVYSLGVLLYELLISTTPFDHDTLRKAALDEVRRIIREQEPPKPSTRLSSLSGQQSTVSTNRQTDPRKLNHQLRGELDWITMKALEKDRSRRYDTAGAFSADIARYRSHQPVEAGPPSAWYRGRKFARRHRLALTMTAVVVLSSALVGGGMWAWSTGRIDRARRDVEQSRNEASRRAIEARHHRYAFDMRQAQHLAQDGQGFHALELLRKHRPASEQDDLRDFAWFHLMHLCHGERQSLGGHKGAVYHAGFSPDGRTLVSCGQDGTVRLWEVATGRSLRTLPATDHGAEVNSAEFSSDGRTLITAGDDGKIRLWDVATRGIQATIPAHRGAAGARFAPDGRRLFSGGRQDHLIKLWEPTRDPATYQQLRSIKASDNDLENGAFSPDGRTLATTGADGFVKLWNLADLSLKQSISVQRGPVYGLAFSADGTRLATGDVRGQIKVWDLSSGLELPGFRGFSQHTADIQSVAYLAGDRMIAAAGGYGILKLWGPATGQCLGSLLGHSDKIWGISVSPDGSTLATASSDGTVKLWDGRPTPKPITLPIVTANQVGTMDYTFTQDGRTLVVARAIGRRAASVPEGTAGYILDADQEVLGLDPITGTERFRRVLAKGKPTGGCILSPLGEIVIFGGTDRVHTSWDVATGKRLAVINGLDHLGWASDRHFIGKVPYGPVERIDAVSGETRLVLAGTEFSPGQVVSPKGDVIAMRDGDQWVIWDLATGLVARKKRVNRGLHTVATFSPDRTILATGEGGGAIQLWDVATLEPRGALILGHSAVPIRDLAFSPDGRTLVSNCHDRTVKLWDVTTGDELITLRWPTGVGLSRPRFSPDGRTLVFMMADSNGLQLQRLTTALPPGLETEEGR